MRANGSPIAKLERKLSRHKCAATSGGHTTCLRAQLVARLLYARLIVVFSLLGWLRRAGMSHSLGSLRRTVTMSSPGDRETAALCRARDRAVCLSMAIKLSISFTETFLFAATCQSVMVNGSGAGEEEGGGHVSCHNSRQLK